MLWTLLKTLLFTALIPGTVTIYVPSLLLEGEAALPDHPARWLSLIPLLLGGGLYAWCAWDFAVSGLGTPSPIDPPKRLVARGPYRFVRNPMYVAKLLIVVGQSLLFGSLALARYALLLAVLFHVFVVLYEEPHLRARFGASYREYCKSVRRWLPRLHPAAPTDI